MRDIGKNFAVIKTIFLLPLIVLVVTSCTGNPVGSEIVRDEISVSISNAQLIDPAALFVETVEVSGRETRFLYQELQDGTSEEVLFRNADGDLLRLELGAFRFINRDFFMVEYWRVTDLDGFVLESTLRPRNNIVVRTRDSAAFALNPMHFDSHCSAATMAIRMFENHLMFGCDMGGVYRVDTNDFDVIVPLSNPEFDSFFPVSTGNEQTLIITEDGDVIANKIYFFDQRPPINRTRMSRNHLYDGSGRLYGLSIYFNNEDQINEIYATRIRVNESGYVSEEEKILGTLDTANSSWRNVTSSYVVECRVCNKEKVHLRFENGFGKISQLVEGFDFEFIETKAIPSEADVFDLDYAYWSDSTTIYRAQIAENAPVEIVVHNPNLRNGGMFSVSNNVVTYLVNDGLSVHTYQIIPGGEPELVSTSGGIPRKIFRF